MKKILISLLITCGLAFSLILTKDVAFLHMLELKLFDLRMNLRPAPIQDERIVFVEMDSKAMENLGRWPWPRDTNAFIIETLKLLGAKHILFDVTFSKPSQLIVDQQKINDILNGKNQLNEYIGQVTDGVSLTPILEKQNILQGFKTIHLAVNELTSSFQKVFKDTDLILETSLKNNDVFMGYEFEVLHDPRDVRQFKRLPQLKLDINDLIQKHLQKPFNEILPLIKQAQYFDHANLKSIFLKRKMSALLKENFSLSLDVIASALKTQPKDIQPYLNSVKRELIRTNIQTFLKENPKKNFVDVTYHYEIFDKDLQNLYKDVWEELATENTFIQKFGLPTSSSQNLLNAINISPPLLKFTNAIKGAGMLNGIPNLDGTLRTVPLFVQYENKIFPHIGLASMLAFLNPQKTSFIPNKYFILHNPTAIKSKNDIYIPINNNGEMIINWAGKWKETFKHISCADIIWLYSFRKSLAQMDPSTIPKEMLDQLNHKETELKKLIHGSISIIGLTAAGTHDYNPIPYEPTYPMVGTHGNVINSILTNQFLQKVPDTTNTLVLIFLALLMGLCLTFFSPIGGLIFTVIVVLGCFSGVLFVFHQGVWIDLASPLLLSFFSYLGITSYKFATEEKEKRWVKKAFSQYVSKDVLDEIISDPKKLQLGGEKRVITVLFSDIRAFTTYSEKRQPEEVVSILNEYLDAMTQVVFDNKGTLDKYVGDEIMALFGAPNFQPPEVSAKQAVITACQMLDKLKELHQKWAKEGLEPLDIGIGINTGEMVVGNMGSTLHMDYTVIGDAVNLGARVEALTRQYNAHLIVSEFTYPYIKDIVDAQPLEAIKVKGKNIPVMIYRVNGLK